MQQMTHNCCISVLSRSGCSQAAIQIKVLLAGRLFMPDGADPQDGFAVAGSEAANGSYRQAALQPQDDQL